MMSTQQIPLAIYGNRLSSAGYEPLYWLNAPPFPELPNLGYPGVADVPYYFVVRNADGYTQLTLVHNNVKSYMAARPGMLKISISIPYGYALAAGASPYDVLMRVRETFAAQCMTPIAGTSGGYNFRERMAPDEVFLSILAQFQLVPRRCALKPMRGRDTAIMLADANSTRLFMLDTHYPELAGYSEVVVSASGDTDMYPVCVRGLQIPRRINYRLYVNGQPRQWNVPNYYDETTVIRSQEDESCFEVVQGSFSVSQLLSGPVGSVSADGYGFRADIDPERERVDVRIKARPRTKTITMDVVGLSHEDVRRFIGGARVYTSDGQPVQHSGGRFTLKGYELLSSPKVKYPGGEYRIVDQGVFSSTLRIRAEKPKAPVRSAQAKGVPTVSIYLQDARDIKDRSKAVTFSFLNLQTLKSINVKGRFLPSDDPSFAYVVSIMMPEECVGNVELSFSTDTVSYKGTQKIAYGDNMIPISSEKTQSQPFYVRFRKQLIIGGAAGALLVLLAGILLSVFGIIRLTGTHTDAPQAGADSTAVGRGGAEEQAGVIATPPQVDADDPESVRFYLSREDIAFDDVDYLYEQLTTSSLRDIDPDLNLQVDRYRTIVGYLREGKLIAADGIHRKYHVLLPQHEQYFNAAFASYIDENGRKQNYTQQQAAAAKRYFSAHSGEFRSFMDMNNIAYAPEVAEAKAAAAPPRDAAAQRAANVQRGAAPRSPEPQTPDGGVRSGGNLPPALDKHSNGRYERLENRNENSASGH